MKSGWRVCRQKIDGAKKYMVYRLKDVSRAVHSGNMEYAPGMEWTKDKINADKAAVILNQLGGI